jgi:hypothetical protein
VILLHLQLTGQSWHETNHFTATVQWRISLTALALLEKGGALRSLRPARDVQCRADIDKVEILSDSLAFVLSPVSICVMVAEGKVMPKSKQRVYCRESGRLERISNCASIYVGRVTFGTFVEELIC